MKQLLKLRYISKLFILLVLLVPLVQFSTVNAAPKITQKSGQAIPSKIYIGKSYTLKANIKNAYFSSSNLSIASIQRNTGKLTLKYPGTFKIYLKSNRNKKVIAYKTITVLRRMDYLTSNKTDISLTVGQSEYLNIQKNPAHSTDIITFKSSNSNVVSVNQSGLINAKSAGTAKVVAYSKIKASVPNNSANNKKLVFNITVFGTIQSAKQTAKNTVEVKFNSMPDTISTNDFTIKDLFNQPVSISLAEKSTTDNNTVILTLSRNIMDGRTYNVVFHGNSRSFTATTGEIDRISITPTTVKTNAATEIKATAYDKNGLVLDEYLYGNKYTNVEFTLHSPYGLSNNKLILYKDKDTATARVIYRNYKNGIAHPIDSGNTTIKAYQDTTANSNMVNFSIANTPTFAFSEYNTYSNSIPRYASGYYAHFKILNSEGREVTDYSQYHVEASNNEMLLIDQTLYNGKKYVNIMGLKQGSANLYLKGPYNSTIATIPIYITEELTPSYITTDKNYLTLPSSNNTLTFNLKDQLDNDCPSYLVSIKCTYSSSYIDTADKINGSLSSYLERDDNKITFHDSGKDKGTYTYVLYYNNIERTITVTIQ